MCFRIDLDAKPWEHKIVYKVLVPHYDKGTGTRVKGRWDSPYYRTLKWKKGKTYQIARHAQTAKAYGYSDDKGLPVSEAYKGIYVLGTFKAAKKWARYEGFEKRGVIAKMAVDPKDFLHTSSPKRIPCQIAAYRKVTFLCITRGPKKKITNKNKKKIVKKK